ncbi:MAG TPA: hypothetical protein VFO52_06110 [Longimicrobiales bacterium]|nr:hypothetical protein [Longimicrobiales bacterium]
MKRSFMESLVAQAVLAPNNHNTQPWLFRITDDAIELRADRTRSLPVVDPNDRALVISCGAALGNLRAAILGAGHKVAIARFPNIDDPDLLARVTIDGPHEVDQVDRARAEAITLRRTNRAPFQSWEVPKETLRTVQKTAAAEGALLYLLTDPEEKSHVADLIAEGDRVQAHDPEFRKELAHWLHPNQARARDGMPANTFGVGDIMSVPYPLVVRTFDWGNSRAHKDHELAVDAPVLGVLGTTGDSAAHWLHTGEALAVLLLDLTVSGLSASFFNQPIEVPALRSALRATLGLSGWPQMIFRIGYGREVPAAPRRVLADVVMN